MDFQKGSLQIDGDTIQDEYAQIIVKHPSIQQAEKRIKDLEAQLMRVMNYLAELDKGLVVKKTNEEGEVEYVRF